MVWLKMIDFVLREKEIVVDRKRTVMAIMSKTKTEGGFFLFFRVQRPLWFPRSS